MLHKTLQTKAQTLTDKGEFTALAAAYSVDRVNDRIVPGAFQKSIDRWQSSGQRIPLHWDHSGAAEDIIGVVDPASMKEVELGLMVSGTLDLKHSAVAREAWRSIKNNAVALSFGYMTTRSRKRKDGVNELLELDLFEISVVPAPANPDTKFLSFKGAETALEDAKAVWSAAYINDLPDSAFLYVEPGGEKDEEGKTTPRSLRHFPVKNAEGDVDMPHLRNALSRIPQSNLSQSVKDRCAAKAQRMMDAMKSISAVEDGGDEEPERAKSTPQDPLVQEAWALLLPKRTPRRAEPEPEPEPEPLDPVAVQREAWALALKTSGR